MLSSISSGRPLSEGSLLAGAGEVEVYFVRS
jgi:hypothetical protein